MLRAIDMNYFLSILPDAVSSPSEPIAILLWGVALVLLTFLKPGNKVVVSQEAAPAGQSNNSPLVARVS